jgi:hypothetical protein
MVEVDRIREMPVSAVTFHIEAMGPKWDMQGTWM